MEQIIIKYIKKYKQDLLSVSLAAAGLVLFFVVLIPQFTGILEFREELDTQSETNNSLRNSVNVLNSLNDTQLDEDYNLVLSALPVSKGIGSVYSALNNAALDSNVSIGSLNLQVGSVYSIEEDPRTRNVDGVPFLNLLVRVNGGSTADTQRFAQVLYEKLPLNEINSIAATNSDGRYDVDFFFKPINTKSFQAQTQIQQLSPSQQELLKTLRSWSE